MAQTPISDFRGVLALFPNKAELADHPDMEGVPYGTILSWSHRSLIPRNYHARLVATARAMGIRGLSMKLLTELLDKHETDRETRRRARRGVGAAISVSHRDN